MIANTIAATVGDFIEVPAWDTVGCILKVRPAMLGSEHAVEVLLQETPDAPEDRCRWYRLEPEDFRFVD